ncbi:hypothetical protein GCM10009850_111290 [Nonomuraea monospora]|uniref:Uncharacterized protein n=1 Tax=Nonomuraea monospora TaxID=568818 RepID=A0ABN3D1I7_9ACTN
MLLRPAHQTVTNAFTALRLLVGAKNSAALCDLRVLVDQPAEAVTSDDLDIVLDRVGKGSQRGGLALSGSKIGCGV